MSILRNLGTNDQGAASAEFALVVWPLLLLMLGTIDVGRYLWAINQAEKATQMGVRYAVVSDPVASVVNADFVDYGIPGGDAVPTATFDSAVCTSTGDCTVTGAASGANGRNPAAFTAIVDWMRHFDPAVTAPKVTVTYQNVGVGYSGDPTGPDVAALTTVEVKELPFQSLILLGMNVGLPTIRASLTLEDGECSTTDDCGWSN